MLSNQWLRRREPGAPPLGSDTMLVSVATTLSLDRASVDGVSAAWANHPTSAGAEPDGATNRYVTTVTVLAGATVEIRLHLHGGSSPTHHRGVTFVHQPLAVDDRVRGHGASGHVRPTRWRSSRCTTPVSVRMPSA